MPEWLRYLAEILIVAVVPLLIWNARILLDLGRQMREVQITVFGRDGGNGLNGDVKALKQSERTHGERLQDHGYRIHTLEEGRP